MQDVRERLNSKGAQVLLLILACSALLYFLSSPQAAYYEKMRRHRNYIIHSSSRVFSSKDSETTNQRSHEMPFDVVANVSLVLDAFIESSHIPQIECAADCSSSLLSFTFCLLPPSRTFHSRLLASLRAGCIPVVMSDALPLPFQNQMNWRLALFRFPQSMTESVPLLLKEVNKATVVKMRRKGREFLARIDNAQTFSNTLVSALVERIEMSRPQKVRTCFWFL